MAAFQQRHKVFAPKAVNLYLAGLMTFFVILASGFPQPDLVFAQTPEKVTVTDMAGRRLQVVKNIKKIIPLGAAARFIVYMQSLDLVAGMEAIETKWTTAGRPYGLATFAKAETLPVIGAGGPGKLPDFEKIITVWPDIVLAMGIDIAQVETIQQKTGIPVFVLSYGTPGTIDIATIKEAFRTLGQLLDRNARADQLIATLDSLKKDLADRTERIAGSARPRAYVGAISYMGIQPITSTESFFVPLAWAGGRNVVDAVGRTGHFFVDPEKLLAWNPEHIFIDAGGLDKVADDYRRNPEFYHRLKAVQQGHVFLIMPYNNYHTNLEIALADAYFIGKVLYPEVFTDIDPATKADEIFSFFIGIPAYTTLSKEYHGFGRVQFDKNGHLSF
ncbi:iron ABC transporter substrate-binding protein [Desulfopila sp. IMCC35006]|uniref:iron ABC transporter substrate-binding protein n=1 Tax=Desulfopila sp. IMCC35006 TaxID=2569542 RepID=UPI0010ACD0CC|nr:iron ABC transporter substrate-binding protein [Desulfopila sp. IMCC35006]TKB24492.1 iron ABC transporter substrate-binding protein [Desulfopila sp. IMCC35006]